MTMALKSGRKYSVVCKPRLARAAALASLGISLIQVDGMHIATKKKLDAEITSTGESFAEMINLSGKKVLYVGGSVNENKNGKTRCGKGIAGYQDKFIPDYIFVVGDYASTGYGPCVVYYLNNNEKVHLVRAEDVNENTKSTVGDIQPEPWETVLESRRIMNLQPTFNKDKTEKDPRKIHFALVQHYITSQLHNPEVRMMVFNGGAVSRYEAGQPFFKGITMLNGQGVPFYYNNVLYVGGKVKTLEHETVKCGDDLTAFTQIKMRIDYIFVVGDYAKKGYGKCVVDYLKSPHGKGVPLLVLEDPNPKAGAGDGNVQPWSTVLSSDEIIHVRNDLVWDLSDTVTERERHWKTVKHVFDTKFTLIDEKTVNLKHLQYHMLVFNGGITMIDEANEVFFREKVDWIEEDGIRGDVPKREASQDGVH